MDRYPYKAACSSDSNSDINSPNGLLINEPLLECPYNPYHQVLESRFDAHILACSEDHTDKPLAICPYNTRHRVPDSQYAAHLKTCPNRYDEMSHEAQQEDFEDDRREALKSKPICACSYGLPLSRYFIHNRRCSKAYNQNTYQASNVAEQGDIEDDRDAVTSAYVSEPEENWYSNDDYKPFLVIPKKPFRYKKQRARNTVRVSNDYDDLEKPSTSRPAPKILRPDRVLSAPDYGQQRDLYPQISEPVQDRSDSNATYNPMEATKYKSMMFQRRNVSAQVNQRVKNAVITYRENNAEPSTSQSTPATQQPGRSQSPENLEDPGLTPPVSEPEESWDDSNATFNPIQAYLNNPNVMFRKNMSAKHKRKLLRIQHRVQNTFLVVHKYMDRNVEKSLISVAVIERPEFIQVESAIQPRSNILQESDESEEPDQSQQQAQYQQPERSQQPVFSEQRQSRQEAREQEPQEEPASSQQPTHSQKSSEFKQQRMSRIAANFQPPDLLPLPVTFQQVEASIHQQSADPQQRGELKQQERKAKTAADPELKISKPPYKPQGPSTSRGWF